MPPLNVFAYYTSVRHRKSTSISIFVNCEEYGRNKPLKMGQTNQKGGAIVKKKRIFPILAPESTSGINGMEVIDTDPQGSYTGRPENLDEIPVQDADDL